MTISKRIRSQLFAPKPVSSITETAPADMPASPIAVDEADKQLIRLPLTHSQPGAPKRASRANQKPAVRHSGLGWTDEEHERFLQGLELFPTGPWKQVAAHVGTRTTRQTMTHAQKYRQKIQRRQRGLMVPVRKPVSILDCAGARKATPVARKSTNSIQDGTIASSTRAQTDTPAITAQTIPSIPSTFSASSPSPAEQLLLEMDFDLDFLDVDSEVQADSTWHPTASISPSEAISIIIGEDEQALIPLPLDATVRCSLATDVYDPIAAMFEVPSTHPATESPQHNRLQPQQQVAPSAPLRPTILLAPLSTDLIHGLLPYEFYF